MSFLELIWIIFLSILPVSELRGGMIYSVVAGINPLTAFFICTIANILAIFIAFFFLDCINKWLMKMGWYRNFFNSYLEKKREKIKSLEKSYSNYGFLALATFVAIPLPGTGAWTGCLISWILGLDRKKSILVIILGVIGAGIIVLLSALGIINLIKLV